MFDWWICRNCVCVYTCMGVCLVKQLQCSWCWSTFLPWSTHHQVTLLVSYVQYLKSHWSRLDERGILYSHSHQRMNPNDFGNPCLQLSNTLVIWHTVQHKTNCNLALYYMYMCLQACVSCMCARCVKSQPQPRGCPGILAAACPNDIFTVQAARLALGRWWDKI